MIDHYTQVIATGPDQQVWRAVTGPGLEGFVLYIPLVHAPQGTGLAASHEGPPPRLGAPLAPAQELWRRGRISVSPRDGGLALCPLPGETLPSRCIAHSPLGWEQTWLYWKP